MARASDEGERTGFVPPPDYELDFEPSPKRVRVVFKGTTVADSTRAMVMRETRLPPVYYLPRDDVRMDLMRPTDHHTHCPFKGNANYWHLHVDGQVAENALWSYEDPFEEAAHVKDYVAFYAQKMDALYEEDDALSLDEAAAAHAHPNRFVDWLLREAWEAATSEELVARLARRLVEVGIPLWRLRLIIRTLHPQMMGTIYTWRRGGEGDGVTVNPASHHLAESAAFIDSPFFLVFQGEGGLRRRLDAPDARLDFPVLVELQAEGATDYVAMPLLFSDGQINVITLASDRPGGFTTANLGQVYEILPLLSRLFEVQAMRLTTKTILDTYLGIRTGERVLTGLIKRGDGARIPAVIWFVDLRGSTAMAESMERTSYLALLNDFFECTAGAVLEHGGEVLKFIGDAVLAIFPIQEDGASAAEGQPVDVACGTARQAAQGALDRLEALNRDRSTRGDAPIRCALALHLGEVTYGNVGIDKRLDFTVIGPAANEAARLSDACKTLGQVVVASAEFARHAPDGLVTLGRHTMRGVSGEREVFGLGA